jgi:hypothetical protein
MEEERGRTFRESFEAALRRVGGRPVSPQDVDETIR